MGHIGNTDAFLMKRLNHRFQECHLSISPSTSLSNHSLHLQELPKASRFHSDSERRLHCLNLSLAFNERRDESSSFSIASLLSVILSRLRIVDCDCLRRLLLRRAGPGVAVSYLLPPGLCGSDRFDLVDFASSFQPTLLTSFNGGCGDRIRRLGGLLFTVWFASRIQTLSRSSLCSSGTCLSRAYI